MIKTQIAGTEPSRSSHDRWTLAVGLVLLVLSAFYIRLLLFLIWGGTELNYLGWAEQNYNGTLSFRYVEMANSLFGMMTGLSLGFDGEPNAPFSLVWGGSPAQYPPGYPTFLAVAELAGLRRLQDVRVLQMILDSLAIVPVALILRRLGASASLCLLGAALYAVSPWLARGCTFILGEAMLPALVVCVLLLLLRAKGSASVGRWFGLGFTASILPMFRPDMLLLIVPLAFWSLFNAPRGRRLLLTAVLITGFAILPVCWGVFNLLARGVFQLTSSAGGYVAWAGLGMIPNSYGYYTNDVTAIEELRSHGITFLSAQSDAYWRARYFQAWQDHPAFVLQTIAFRLALIFNEVDYYPTQWGSEWPRIFAHTFLVIAVLGLLLTKRYAYAFVVAGPMVYALGSLGLLYVEARYVRYATISYVLSFPLSLQIIYSASIARLFSRRPRAQQWASRAFLSVVTVAAPIVVIFCGSLLVPEARAWAFEAAMRNETHLPVRLSPAKLVWLPEYQGGAVLPQSGDAVQLTTSARPGDLYSTKIPVDKGRPFYVRLNSQLHEGQLAAVIYNINPPRRPLGRVYNSWKPTMHLSGLAGDDEVLLVFHNRGTAPYSLAVRGVEVAVSCREDGDDWLALMNEAVNPFRFHACPVDRERGGG